MQRGDEGKNLPNSIICENFQPDSTRSKLFSYLDSFLEVDFAKLDFQAKSIAPTANNLSDVD